MVFFEPIEDRLLVKPEPKSTKTIAGLEYSQTAVGKERPERGIVVAAGKGRIDNWGRLIPVTFEVGDLIVFPKTSGIEIKLSEGSSTPETYVVVRERDCHGKIITDPSKSFNELAGYAGADRREDHFLC